MNLFNATLTSLSNATTTAAGSGTWQTASPLGVRCSITDVIQRQREELGATIKDATAVMYVKKSVLVNIAPTEGMKCVASIDGSDAVSYRIAHVRNREKRGGLAHWECFLQKLPEGAA